MYAFLEFPLLICHSLLKLARLAIAEGDLTLFLSNSIDCDSRKCCRIAAI